MSASLVVPVVKMNYVKCLGVIIDESLSWGPHVEYVKKTVSSNLGMLNIIRNYVPQSSLHSLCVCLVTPSLDYCCTVWGGWYIYHDNILNKCLKRAARIILQCAFLTPSADMFSKLNWLSFSERVNIILYRKATLVFKCVNRMTPIYITHLFTPLTHRYSRNETIDSYCTDDSFFQKRIAIRHEFCCEWCNHVERLASTITNNNLFNFVQTPTTTTTTTTTKTITIQH